MCLGVPGKTVSGLMSLGKTRSRLASSSSVCGSGADERTLDRGYFRREYLRREALEWERKAEVAVSKGRDDLAKGALVERNRADEATDSIDRELAILDDNLSKLNEDVGLLQAKIKDAKARQNAIIMRGKTAQTRLGVRRQLSEHNVDDAMLRFENYERKMDDLEGQVEAYDMGQRTLADEIAELESDEVIDEELKKLKARLSASTAGGQGTGSAGVPASVEGRDSAEQS